MASYLALCDQATSPIERGKDLPADFPVEKRPQSLNSLAKVNIPRKERIVFHPFIFVFGVYGLHVPIFQPCSIPTPAMDGPNFVNRNVPIIRSPLQPPKLQLNFSFTISKSGQIE